MLAGVCVLLVAAMSGVAEADLNQTQLSDAITGVSIDLFRAVTAGNVQNRVLSPLSVNILLALLEQGAKGESSRQLQTALRLGRSELREGYGGLSADLQRSESENLQLTVANHIFIDEGFPLREDFLQTATRDFHSGVSNVTFSSGDASAEINSWVAKETRGKITDIVEPVLPAATVMVLANAIYFKSPWLKKFEKSLTNNNTFSVDPTRNVTVPFMYQEDSFLYGSSEELKVKWVELLFKDTNYSLLVVLPNERFGLADVLANLTSSHISGMLQGGSWTGVRLYLPRFNLNSNTKLVSALKELGIRDVFESGLSDLSGISASKEPLSVSDVVQKATMEIDEDGGVASAATVVEFVALSSLVFLDSEEFRTDHQFLAVIVNKNGNVPLFMATIVDPSVD